MLDLSEITRRAQETPRQTTDVEVVFDTGLTAELETLRTERAALEENLEQVDSDLDAELAVIKNDLRASDPRPAALRKQAEDSKAEIASRFEGLDARIDAVNERAADFLVTFRFTALHGFEWRDLTARSAPRDGVEEDQNRGYNVDEVAKIAASRTGQRVTDDGAVIDIPTEQWDAVWATLPAIEFNRVVFQIQVLNEYATFAARTQAVDAARKVSAARQAATQHSPSTSGSTPDASAGGNPSPSPTTSTTIKAA